MKKWQGILIALVGVGLFHIAYSSSILAFPAILGFLICMYALAWLPSRRWAFYLGFAVGFMLYAPHLAFFYGIFGVAAIPLWAVLALWPALFLVAARIATRRWPRWGGLAIPVLWLAQEYFRCELYYLRFPWLTPGLSLSHPIWYPLLAAGVYGFGFLALLAIALFHLSFLHRQTGKAISLVLICTLPFLWGSTHRKQVAGGPIVAGVQFEDEVNEHRIIEMLDDVAAEHPEAELIVLSEYAFMGDIPTAVREWTKAQGVYLVAGGKDYLPDQSDFYNTAYVIGPDGNEVFRQVKSVPIQFFDDGIAARRQKLWNSPWGKVGIAICYDMNYTRVTDRLVAMGAEALIIPTFDSITWGRHQHELHANVTPIRAREYGVPIFRVASSGISQLVDGDGVTHATAPYDGVGEHLGGKLQFRSAGRRPVDRWLGLPAVAAVLLVGAAGLGKRLTARRILNGASR